jgi:hypothetical protein
VYHHHPSFLRATVLMSLLSFRRGQTPPKRPVTHFSQPDGKLNYSLHDFRFESLPHGLVEYPLTS